MKEISTYQACKILQQKQLANLAMNSVYWSTRFDYLTIYEYMLAHYPERQRGYRSEIANSLSFSKLGGGIWDLLTQQWCKTPSKQWNQPSTFNPNHMPQWIKANFILLPFILFFAIFFSHCT